MTPDTCRVIGDFLAQLGGPSAVIVLMTLTFAIFMANLSCMISAAIRQWPNRQTWQRSASLVYVALSALGNAALTFGVIFLLLEFFNALQRQQG